MGILSEKTKPLPDINLVGALACFNKANYLLCKGIISLTYIQTYRKQSKPLLSQWQ